MVTLIFTIKKQKV